MNRIGHKDFNVKTSAATIILQFVPDIRIHRFITKSDVKNLLDLLKREDGQNNTAVMLGLKNLVHLTETDEFMDMLYSQNAHRLLIKLLADGIDEDSDLVCVHVLHNLLCSIHGKDIVKTICEMPKNEGLRALVSLLSPPTIDNVQPY